MNPIYRKHLVNAISVALVKATAAAERDQTSAKRCNCPACILARQFYDAWLAGRKSDVDYLLNVGNALLGKRLEVLARALERGSIVGDTICLPNGKVVVTLDNVRVTLEGNSLTAVDTPSVILKDAVSATAQQIAVLLGALSDNELKVLAGGLSDQQIGEILDATTKGMEEEVGELQALVIFAEDTLGELGMKKEYVVVDEHGNAKQVNRDEFLNTLREEQKPPTPEPQAPKPPVTQMNQVPTEPKPADRIRKAAVDYIRTSGPILLDDIMVRLNATLPVACRAINDEYVNGVRAYVRDYLYRVASTGIINIDNTTRCYTFAAK